MLGKVFRTLAPINHYIIIENNQNMIENNGLSLIKIKGLGDSLHVTVNVEKSPDLLKEELGKSFEKLQHLAVNAKVILDTGDGGPGETLFKNLSSYLLEKFELAGVTRAETAAQPQDTPAPRPQEQVLVRNRVEEKIRLRDAERGWEFRRSEVLMIAGRVRAGQKVNAKKHLVVLGDVNPGAEISAGGDILVMGSLCGTAMAGLPDNETAIILALDFRPTQIQIAGLVAAGHKSEALKTAEFAHIDSGGIVVEPFMGNNPFSKIPWPEVR